MRQRADQEQETRFEPIAKGRWREALQELEDAKDDEERRKIQFRVQGTIDAEEQQVTMLAGALARLLGQSPHRRGPFRSLHRVPDAKRGACEV